MTQKRRFISCFLVLAITLSLTNGLTARAASSVTITLRIEQDESMMAPPVQITLTDADTQTDYGLGLATGPVTSTATPLHALAKFMRQKGADHTTMKQYIAADFTYGSAYITGISIQGKCGEAPYGSAASGSQDNVYWGFTVNDAAPIDPVTHMGCAADQYTLKNNDSIVFYGLWNAWPAEDETLYSYFDKPAYTAQTDENIIVSLKGSGMTYDEQFHSIAYTKAVTGAAVTAAEYTSSDSMATEQNAIITALTGADGKAVLTFKKAGKYVLSASRRTADGKHFDISRPYAVVTVNSRREDPITAGNGDKNTTSSQPKAKAKKPAKVKKVRAVAKKSGKSKKSVILSWKKVSGAAGFRVYVSKKKKKGYKMKKNVKKNRAVIRLKKGTYYFKVRAYRRSKNKVLYGAYSTPIKVKVKRA